jgi:hypothetical protein
MWRASSRGDVGDDRAAAAKDCAGAVGLTRQTKRLSAGAVARERAARLSSPTALIR